MRLGQFKNSSKSACDLSKKLSVDKKATINQNVISSTLFFISKLKIIDENQSRDY